MSLQFCKINISVLKKHKVNPNKFKFYLLKSIVIDLVLWNSLIAY